jgi:hypothetical protein
MPQLTGPEMEELCGAICDAFSAEALEQMVRFKLGKVLYDLVKPGALKDVAFALVRVGEQEGWVDSLIAAIALVRRDNAKVVAFCQAHRPQALDPPQHAQLVRGVSSGLDALLEILKKFADPTVRAVVSRFGDDFRNGQKTFDFLKRYKALHDRLHTLQFQYCRQVADAAARFRQDESQFLALQSYAARLHQEVERARDEIDGLPTRALEEDWVDDYERAVRALDGALDANDDGACGRAVAALKVLLGQAPRINNNLANCAGELPLGQLGRAMGEIETYLRGPAAGGGGSLPLEQFFAGRSALEALRPRLAGLVEEHYEWQWLDKEFTAADALPGRSAAEKFPRWEKVRDRLRRLCDLARDQPWARQLAPLTGAVEAQTDPVPFGRTFNKFRDLAAERFFRVDQELRDLSEELVEVAKPLGVLVSLVSGDGGGPRP